MALYDENPLTGVTTAPKTTSGGATGTIPTFSITAPTGGSTGSRTTSRRRRSSSGGGSNQASALASLERYMIDLGLPGSLASWAFGLLKQGYSMDGVEAELYKRGEFRARFKGIFRKDGGLIVSPKEYIQLEDAYRSIGSRFNVGVDPLTIEAFVQNEVSPEEAETRLRALQVVQSRPDVFQNLSRLVDEYNSTAPSKIAPVRSVADAVGFLLGKGDREVYNLYEQAAIRSAQQQIGLDTSRAGLIAEQTEGVLDINEIEKRYAQIKQDIDFAGPELQAFGVTAADQENAEFGVGQNRVNAIVKLEQALRQRKAQVQSTLATTQTGLAGTRPVQPTGAQAGF